MSVDLGTIFASVKLDTAGLRVGVSAVKASISGLAQDISRSMRTAEGSFGSFVSTIQRNSSQLHGAGLAMSIAITAPIVAAAGLAANAAMDAVESENLFEVSMGKMAGAAREWSEQIRAQLGLNAVEVRKNVATFNVMFDSMGLGEQKAYDMATGLTKLAYDMASFYNLNPEEAFQKLQSGISGEIEPLRRLGIVVSENAVKQYAYKAGLAVVGKELTDQQKILGRYGLIMQATSKAQGDLARTIDSPVNQLRVLRSDIVATSIEFGKEMIPAIKWVVGEVKVFVAWLNNLSPAGKGVVLVVLALTAAIGPLLIGLSALSTAITVLSAESLAAMVTPLGWILAGIAALGLVIYGVVKAVGLFNRETKKSTDELAKEATANREATQAKVAEISATGDQIREYEALRDKKSRTNTETERMNELGDQIVSKNPGLLGAINKQTGHFELLNDAIQVNNRDRQKNIDLLIVQTKLESQIAIKKGREAQAKLPIYEKAMKEKTTVSTARVATKIGNKPWDKMTAREKQASLAHDFEDVPLEEQLKTSKEVGGLRADIEAASAAKQVLDYIDKYNKLPPTPKPAAGGATPVKPGKAPTGAGRVDLVQADIKKLQSEANNLQNSMTRAIELKDFDKASARLKRLDAILGTELPAAYQKLASAEQRAAGMDLKQAKTGDERESAIARQKQANIDLTDNLNKTVDEQIGLHKSLNEAKIAQGKDAADKLKALNDKAAEEAESRFQAQYDAEIQIARAKGDELGTIDLEFAKSYRDALDATGSKEKALALATMEADKKRADYKKKLADDQKTLDDKAFSDKITLLRRELDYGDINYLEYVKQLQAMLNAYSRYSDEYETIRSAIRSGSDSQADDIIGAVEKIVGVNKEGAIKVLRGWIEVYELLGLSTEALQKKLDELLKINKKATKNFWEDWHAVIDSIKVNFIDAITAMIEGTSSFGEFFKQVWHEILRFAVTQMAIMVEKWIAAQTKMKGASGGGFFGNLLGGVAAGFGSMLGAGLFGKLLPGLKFDNPINDTSAVRSGQDFARLFKQGGMSELGGAFPKAPAFSAAGGGNTVNHNETVQVTTKIEKVSGIDDLKRISEQQAWIISKRLNLAPTS